MSVPDFPSVSVPVVQGLPSVSVPALSSNLMVPVAPLEVVMGSGSNGSGGSSHNMVLSALTPTTITVTGSSTKEFSDYLKKLGGTWNNGIQAWSFDVKYQADVQKFLGAVTEGKIKPDPVMGFNNKKKQFRPRQEFTPSTSVNTGAVALPVVSGDGFALPVVNKGDDSFQTLTWKSVFKPRVGMLAKIKVDDKTMACPVSQVSTNTRGDVVAAYIMTAQGDSILEVTNGHWQVRGLMPDHKIYFDNGQ
jgi:hypothetical protein